MAAGQDDVITRAQLLELGYSRHAIQHRIATGRLHRLWRGVYAVGRAGVTRRGVWKAAVLASGPAAALSHESAAALWRILPDAEAAIHVSVPEGVTRRQPGIRAHRRSSLAASEIVEREGIRVTCPATTLVDIAASQPSPALERAVNDADKHELIDPEALRDALDLLPPRAGGPALRTLLDRRTFVLTDSELERRFLPLARRAGLGNPTTGAYVNGFRVDFHWPHLGLVVETDGLRYHRTPAQQARDRLRDQMHVTAGLTVLRFTHGQVRYEPKRVEATLTAVRARLESAIARD